MSDKIEHVKIVFPLVKDENNYPPDDEEAMWAIRQEDGAFRLDNVPFFVRGVSSGDTIAAVQEGARLVFRSLIGKGGHSTVRLLITDEIDTEAVRNELRQMGCPSELSHIPGFVAVDIPPEVLFGHIRKYLDQGEVNGRWEYEEACIAHKA
jgi:hypothetical protein